MVGRILIVDDEYINRRLLSTSLQQIGHDVVTAEDGQTALDLLHTQSFDVVLLDLLMPGVDGYAVLAELKADDTLRHIPVIVISGLDDVENAIQCIQLGATDYLPKPFNPLLLQARLNASLVSKRLIDLERESAARMQAILETAVDGILTFNGQGIIESTNPTIETLFRYSTAELIGMPVRQLLPDLRIEPTQIRYELVGVRQDQSQFPAEIGIGQVELSETLYTAIVRDMTTQHQIEQMREDLTNTMVHDLRNPLTVILGMMELLSERSSLSPLQENIVKTAQTSAQRMITLVTNILDVSRLESGRMPLAQDAFSLAELLDHVIALQSVLSNEKQLTITQKLADDLPIIIGDVSLIERVLQNLIGNAIKFTPNGGTITVTGTKLETEETAVLISVRDSGPGIIPEIRANLFEKFVTGNQIGRGSGLGLAFCHLAVEAHGGKIWVESQPGHGAAFKFTLPNRLPEEVTAS